VKMRKMEAVDPNNPAIAAEVLQLPGLQDLGRRSSGPHVECCLPFASIIQTN